jgi:hypothetical protein
MSDNLERAKRALAQIEHYGEAGACEDDDMVHQWIGDLLCDLHHLADLRGLDWTDLCVSGEYHYAAEVAEEAEEVEA